MFVCCIIVMCRWTQEKGKLEEEKDNKKERVLRGGKRREGQERGYIGQLRAGQ